jgi:RNA polymerase-binding transcription factor DksA
MSYENVKSRLEERRAELTRQMEIIERDLDKPSLKDIEDAASERQGDEVLESLGAHDAAEVRAIDAALSRIAAGSYGVCVKCGEDIAPARLEAVPTTALCRGCAG